MNIVKLDPGYGSETILFDLDRGLFLRKLNPSNEFFMDDDVKRALTANGFVELDYLKGEKYIAV